MLDEILDSFSITRPVSVKQMKTGLMNQTYRAMNSDGVFALQGIHEVVPDATLGDMHVVTEFLSQHGLQVPRLIKTSDGQLFTRDHNNLRWRLYSWIEGQIFEAIQDTAMAQEAGQLVGKFHKVISQLNYQPVGSIPHFHDTPYILENLEKVVSDLPSDGQALAKTILAEAPNTIIDETKLQAHVIHGDLKISNLLFDAERRAVGLIDFDTLLWRPAAIDMGDALRSWCNRTSEDDAQAQFDNELFEVIETGYQQGFGGDADYRALHRQAAKQIALELSARFLTDVVTDNYFGFDDKRYDSRKAHNWARAVGQYHLATTI